MANNMIIYTTVDGLTKVETTFDRDTVWLTREQMATLFSATDPSSAGTSRRCFLKANWMKKAMCKKCTFLEKQTKQNKP